MDPAFVEPPPLPGRVHTASERLTAATSSAASLARAASVVSCTSAGRLGSAPSAASLHTVRSGSVSPGPPPETSGLLVSPRRFSSRHVPHVAEELAQAPVLPPDIIARLNGLTRRLKPNSDWEERQRQVLDAVSERLIPEEYDETLRNEFERRCAYGERLNTEFMSSGKWVKLLRDAGAVAAPGTEKVSRGTMSLADADIIFRKVLHHADYCGKRLTYESFCKALLLAALAIRPELDTEAALVEILARVAAAAPEESRQLDYNVDHMLDANVLLVLDHFKPALWDIFRVFCTRNLGQAGGPCRGQGTVRLGERTFRRHMQDTTSTDMTLGCTRGDGSSFGEFFPGSEPGFSPQRHARFPGTSCGKSPGQEPCSLSPCTLGKLEEQEQDTDAPSPHVNSEADAGGGFTTPRQQAWQEESSLGLFYAVPTPVSAGERRHSGSPRRPPAGATAEKPTWSLSPQSTMQSIRASICSSSFQSQDLCEYANGAPVIKNRRHYMSVDQLLLLCKELKVMPDLLTRLEVVKIFKRAQCAGAHTCTGSSIHGYLNREAFVDAAGQLAIAAYSKEPYCDEFPEAHEKVQGFFQRVLPSNSHEVHERFLYGCGSRVR